MNRRDGMNGTTKVFGGAGLVAAAAAAVSLAAWNGAATAAPAGADAGGCEHAERAPSPVGQAWTDTTLTDVWFSGERDPGETTLIVFFEVWCPHCKDEMPHLAELDALDGIEVVGLTRMARDTTEAQVRAFVADHDVPFAVGKDTRGLFEQAGARGVPAAIAVRGGEIVWAGHPRTVPDEVVGR